MFLITLTAFLICKQQLSKTNCSAHGIHCPSPLPATAQLPRLCWIRAHKSLLAQAPAIQGDELTCSCCFPLYADRQPSDDLFHSCNSMLPIGH